MCVSGFFKSTAEPGTSHGFLPIANVNGSAESNVRKHACFSTRKGCTETVRRTAQNADKYTFDDGVVHARHDSNAQDAGDDEQFAGVLVRAVKSAAPSWR